MRDEKHIVLLFTCGTVYRYIYIYIYEIYFCKKVAFVRKKAAFLQKYIFVKKAAFLQNILREVILRLHFRRRRHTFASL